VSKRVTTQSGTQYVIDDVAKTVCRIPRTGDGEEVEFISHSPIIVGLRMSFTLKGLAADENVETLRVTTPVTHIRIEGC
jgi:hypothetical protein